LLFGKKGTNFHARTNKTACCTFIFKKNKHLAQYYAFIYIVLSTNTASILSFAQKKYTATAEETEAANEKRLVYNVAVLRNCSLLLLFGNSVINFLQNFLYSFFVTAGASLVLLASVFILKDKYYAWQRNIILFLLNVVIILLSHIEGVASGDYLYIFVYIIGAIFIYDFENIPSLLIAFFIILASLVFIFMNAPLHGTLQRMSVSVERQIFNANVFCCTIITGLLAYLLIKMNFNKSKSLQQKERFLNTIYNTSLDAVFVVNGETGKIEDCNKNSIQVFRAGTITDLRGDSIYALFASEHAEPVKKLLTESAESWQGELTCLTSDHFYFPGYVSIVPFEYMEASYKKISILDISDIKKAQFELTTAKEKAEEAVAAKSRFLSNMSHELRTPLNGIIGTSNLLMQENSPEEQQKHFELLRYSSEHMLSLINDVLDYSKIEAGKMDLEKNPFNAKQMLEKIAAVFAGQFQEKKVSFEVKVDEQLNRSFLGDATKLSQVMANLISNALKFTERGRVMVESRLIQSNSDTASVFFCVSDTGIGIPEDKINYVFESFTQADSSTKRKFGGTGLGLSISKKIVEMYQGKLLVKSTYGSGSTFYFTIQLPISRIQKNFVTEQKVKELTPLNGLRVLMAEDNPVNMTIARKFMQLWHIQVEEASNGKEALTKFKDNLYDILLVDLEMPEMDGYSLLKEIRTTNSSIPAIAFTAAVYDNMHSDLMARGFTDYIQKPFRPEDLHRKLSGYFKLAS
jgi:signal transduction histidine kinase/CheY-like chemotaxis protein